jgi:hypothetical protein
MEFLDQIMIFNIKIDFMSSMDILKKLLHIFHNQLHYNLEDRMDRQIDGRTKCGQ